MKRSTWRRTCALAATCSQRSSGTGVRSGPWPSSAAVPLSWSRATARSSPWSTRARSGRCSTTPGMRRSRCDSVPTTRRHPGRRSTAGTCRGAGRRSTMPTTAGRRRRSARGGRTARRFAGRIPSARPAAGSSSRAPCHRWKRARYASRAFGARRGSKPAQTSSAAAATWWSPRAPGPCSCSTTHT